MRERLRAAHRRGKPAIRAWAAVAAESRHGRRPDGGSEGLLRFREVGMSRFFSIVRVTYRKEDSRKKFTFRGKDVSRSARYHPRVPRRIGDRRSTLEWSHYARLA